MHKSLFVIGLLCLPLLTFAEDSEPKSGRLADGRAYRTDSSGTQLVDYIAELELSVESLKRRVNGLEDEVSEKQKVIERLGKGEALRGALAERDLGTAATVKEVSQKTTQQDEELSRLKREMDKEHQQEISALKDKIQNLEDQIAGQNKSLRSSTDTNARALGEKEAQLLSVREELTNLKADMDLDKQIQTKEADELKHRISELKDELDARDEKVETLTEQLEVANKEIQRVSDERDNLFNVNNRNDESRISQTQEATYKQANLEDTRASFSSAKLKALDSLKSTLFTELNQVGSLQASRDSLMRTYAAQNRAVMFRPTLAISSRGYKADQIRKRVQQAESVRDLSLLKGDLAEVRLKLQDDVALLKRLSGSAVH